MNDAIVFFDLPRLVCVQGVLHRWAVRLRTAVRLWSEIKREDGMAWSTLLKHPSAFLPVVMSSAALATVLVHVAFHGVARQADEGTAAHLWQLLMGLQMPIVAYFALKWLPRTPRQALPVLALQAVAALGAAAPVLLLGF